ncbi:uncharacterized protein LOC109821625 [Asparagus officinalis]|uniref:uncharacterized protein LOC109821625 n=1 Tax=Asparagus officinalis TaxID=4686 RepID=UPI00098DF58B|nr:uncharacterized protein LOC109821625 [Asparagus officinalis]
MSFMVLCLLNSLLLSKTPFTDVFLRKRTPVQDVLSSIGNFLHVKHVSCLLAAGQALSSLKSLLVLKTPFRDIFSQKKRSVQIYKEENEILATEVWNNAFQFKPISVKILENMVTNKVVYAEAGSDFVDVLLSFLTFPLGSIVKLMNCQSSLGCVDNLYGSVELLATTGDFIKSDECKNMLLSPKLYPHFNCDDQILRIGTKLSTDCTVLGCETCYNAGSNECKHNIGRVILNEINPKMPNAVTRSGGGYAERALRFMVTDEMAVAPVSHISVIGAIKELRVPVSILFENEVKLGEREVLNLLKACLISSNPLSQIFSHKSFSHKKLRRIA